MISRKRSINNNGIWFRLCFVMASTDKLMDGVGGRHGVGSSALRFNITTKTHHLICIITGGYSQNVFIGSKLIGLYFELGQFYMQDARKVFDNMSQRDVFIRNMMIQAYANSGFGNEALGVFKEMRGEGVDVDKFTYTFVLKVCGVGSDVMMGRVVNGCVMKCGFCFDVFDGNALVAFYGKCHMVGDCKRVFDEICEKDVVSWKKKEWEEMN
ncbi:pentatricopeptide repeat-containing protein [Tanacetum coccineum]